MRARIRSDEMWSLLPIARLISSFARLGRIGIAWSVGRRLGYAGLAAQANCEGVDGAGVLPVFALNDSANRTVWFAFRA